MDDKLTKLIDKLTTNDIETIELRSSDIKRINKAYDTLHGRREFIENYAYNIKQLTRKKHIREVAQFKALYEKFSNQIDFLTMDNVVDNKLKLPKEIQSTVIELEQFGLVPTNINKILLTSINNEAELDNVKDLLQDYHNIVVNNELISSIDNDTINVLYDSFITQLDNLSMDNVVDGKIVVPKKLQGIIDNLSDLGFDKDELDTIIQSTVTNETDLAKITRTLKNMDMSYTIVDEPTTQYEPIKEQPKKSKANDRYKEQPKKSKANDRYKETLKKSKANDRYKETLKKSKANDRYKEQLKASQNQTKSERQTPKQEFKTRPSIKNYDSEFKSVNAKINKINDIEQDILEQLRHTNIRLKELDTVEALQLALTKFKTETKKTFLDQAKSILNLKFSDNFNDKLTRGLMVAKYGAAGSVASILASESRKAYDNFKYKQNVENIVKPEGYSKNIPIEAQRAMAMSSLGEHGTTKPNWTAFTEYDNNNTNKETLFNIGAFNLTLGTYTKKDGKAQFQWGSGIDYLHNYVKLVEQDKTASAVDKENVVMAKQLFGLFGTKSSYELGPVNSNQAISNRTNFETNAVPVFKTVIKQALASKYNQQAQEQYFKEKVYDKVVNTLTANQTKYNVDVTDSGLITLMTSVANQYGMGSVESNVGLFGMLNNLVKANKPITIDSLTEERAKHSTINGVYKPELLPRMATESNIAKSINLDKQKPATKSNEVLLGNDGNVKYNMTKDGTLMSTGVANYKNPNYNKREEFLNNFSPETKKIVEEASTNVNEFFKFAEYNRQTVTDKDGNKYILGDVAQKMYKYQEKINKLDEVDVQVITKNNQSINELEKKFQDIDLSKTPDKAEIKKSYYEQKEALKKQNDSIANDINNRHSLNNPQTGEVTNKTFNNIPIDKSNPNNKRTQN